AIVGAEIDRGVGLTVERRAPRISRIASLCSKLGRLAALWHLPGLFRVAADRRLSARGRRNVLRHDWVLFTLLRSSRRKRRALGCNAIGGKAAGQVARLDWNRLHT